MSDTDLSRIIGLIMENPKLIEEIKNLASKEQGEEQREISEPEKENVEEKEKADAVPTIAPIENASRIKRRELLSALKPYVSDGRAKAIDSMMSIADILDMMRSN